MIELKLTFTSVAEAVAFLAGREAGNAPVATSTTAGQSAPSASSTKPDASAAAADAKAKAAAKAKADAAAKAKAEAEQTAHEEPAGDAKVDYETEVKPLVVKLAALPADAGGGRDAVVAALKPFGVAKGSDVPADKLADFKAALEAAIAAVEVA